MKLFFGEPWGFDIIKKNFIVSKNLKMCKLIYQPYVIACSI